MINQTYFHDQPWLSAICLKGVSKILFFGVSFVMVFRRAVSLHNDFQKKHFKTIFKHNRPLVTQRHLQAKRSITERNDGVIEGKRSCTPRDLELEESIFQSSSNSICQTYRTTELCGKKPEKLDPGIYNSIHYPV